MQGGAQYLRDGPARGDRGVRAPLLERRAPHLLQRPPPRPQLHLQLLHLLLRRTQVPRRAASPRHMQVIVENVNVNVKVNVECEIVK